MSEPTSFRMNMITRNPAFRMADAGFANYSPLSPRTGIGRSIVYDVDLRRNLLVDELVLSV